MDSRTVRWLRVIALLLVGAVAVLHLVLGVLTLTRYAAGDYLATYLQSQVVASPEPVLFVLSAFVILAGIFGTALGVLSYRTAYAAGIAMMAIYIVAWLAWHTVFDHGLVFASDAAVGRESGEQSHTTLGHVVISHYLVPMVRLATGSPMPGEATVAAVSKTLEALAIAVLGVLLAVDPHASDRPAAAAGDRGTTVADETDRRPGE